MAIVQDVDVDPSKIVTYPALPSTPSLKFPLE